ncbi:DUF6441 family protein [Maricaulis sp.]|uniref:DUF6441 family protein n=1 Tax=Maricaulis sp. TaxID=1486257 RepID=UPI003A8D7B59
MAETLSADFDATLEEMAEVAMAAADTIEAWGKAQLRNDTEAALGPRVARTWRSRVYPNRGSKASIAPSVTWWSNAPHIVRAFSEATTIRAGTGKYLALPTENAPQSGYSFGQSGRMRRTRSAALVAAERRYGRLRAVKVPGKDMILLVADKVQKNKRGYGPASARTLKGGREENGVVMFVLLPQITTRKLIDPQGISDAIGREGLDRFAAAFKDITQRRFGIGES